MKISIISVFPEIHEQFLKSSIIGKAITKGLITVNLFRFSDFCAPKERIDEQTMGHGAGMIIKPDIVAKAIDAATTAHGAGFTIFFSPQGVRLNQPVLKSLAGYFFYPDIPSQEAPAANTPPQQHLILVCSRYEGMDARVEDEYADMILSIGDYVLMGGDLPAQVFLEGFLRLIPGIVGNQASIEFESFSGPFLDHPEYGLPVEWKGHLVPDIIRSGNHAALANWRQEQACAKTLLRRFDWFVNAQPNEEEKSLASKQIPPHYVVLMHDQVKVKDGNEIGTTSITSIDLHDTARSCATYGVTNFFIVSPLVDQHAIMNIFLGFWHSAEGKEYNASRYAAVSRIIPAHSLDEVIARITADQGKPPLLVTTAAKSSSHGQIIDYFSQGTVWAHQRPVLFVFGTGKGLSDELIAKSDYLLIPVKGLTHYNHLSVRSAMAIILDRWLGLQPRLNRAINSK
jgi:tRNA (guanine37-N1)-methyltransferase